MTKTNSISSIVFLRSDDDINSLGDLTKIIDCHNGLANVNQIHGRTKCTALIAAAEGIFKPAVEELLKRGADGNFQSPLYALRTGATALIHAARTGYADIVKTLMTYRSMNGKCAINRGETALFLAVKEQHIEVVRILLDVGADTAFDYMVDDDSAQDDFQVIQYRTIIEVAETGTSLSNDIAEVLLEYPILLIVYTIFYLTLWEMDSNKFNK
ncbi:Aste57867_18073 [Aphanomyces stellatus]|uniref:Aste57867_18073 protein n=1 Tax=Aphanomyces stellatus TaxID=120398 RepID=A0A485LAR0_9STRA|nr:hypothetical protein As57867_018011 [Aphanomyces stellatus]VFT94812.1 Aste57867_18073 [Aphanomyces stellatus]